MVRAETGIGSTASLADLDRRTRVVLRNLRKRAGLTLRDAAKATGISASRLSRLERGRAPLYFDEVGALARLHMIDVGELEDLVRASSDASGPHGGGATSTEATVLDRVPSAEAMLAMICECYGYAPADEDPADVPEHYWGCPAGAVRYWCTRHLAAVGDWLRPYLEGSPPPPVPRS